MGATSFANVTRPAGAVALECWPATGTVNAANKDGRTALDAAQTLKYDSLVKFLLEKGAKPGSGAAAPPDRGKDSGRGAIVPR